MSKKLVSGLLILGVISTSACSLLRDEEKSYINAEIEATCMLAEMDISNITDEDMEKLNKVYSKHGFPVDDANAISQIMAKYENNERVKEAIESATEDCRQKITDNILNSSSNQMPDLDLLNEEVEVVEQEESDLVELEVVEQEEELPSEPENEEEVE